MAEVSYPEPTQTIETVTDIVIPYDLIEGKTRTFKDDVVVRTVFSSTTGNVSVEVLVRIGEELRPLAKRVVLQAKMGVSE